MVLIKQSEISHHLTGDASHRKTHRGQAHFAVGPHHCKQCQFWGGKRPRGATMFEASRPGPCAKFSEMTGEQGQAVPGSALSCKFFKQKQS